MPSITRSIETDVCVVGAGLLGLAHALEARRRGLSVVLLERGRRATGASVRHSGHLFFSGLSSAALETAPLARERWLELSRRAGAAADEGGTLIIARHDDELAVMAAAAAEPARQARMRSRKKLGRLVQLPPDGVLGAFHAKQDLRIAPRSMPGALARVLARDPHARVEWGTHVHEVEPGVVQAGSLRVRAAAIIVCTGADERLLPAELRPRVPGLSSTQTQMLRLAAPGGRRHRQTLMTGLAMLGHAGFQEQDGIAKLTERLELESPELVERAIAPVVTQLADGGLIVGAGATSTRTPSPFSRQRIDELTLDQARPLLGAVPPVRQRWSVLHLSLPGCPDPFLTSRPMPGVRVVQALHSTAAALCHAHAEQVLEHLLVEPSLTDEYIAVRDLRPRSARSGGLSAHAASFGAAS